MDLILQGFANSKVIFKIENDRIKTAIKLISLPLNGRIAKIVASPNNPASPMPHVTHPGTNIPRNIPVDIKNPVFLLILFFTDRKLYIIKLKRIELKILIVIKLKKEEKRIVFLKFSIKLKDEIDAFEKS